MTKRFCFAVLVVSILCLVGCRFETHDKPTESFVADSEIVLPETDDPIHIIVLPSTTPPETEPATEPEKTPSGGWSVSVGKQVICYPQDAADGSGGAYAVVNGNVPFFSQEELSSDSFETYGDMDVLGRCSMCVSCVGSDLMPTEDRGSIGQVKPTGWHTVKYDCVDGKYLYNRCHLIGYQLTAENANKNNLITGTRYLNVTGMLPFENMVADYVRETENHVLYRVTPIYVGDELVARGVLMEAQSIEDDDVLFCVFCFNVQPGVTIRYSDGESWLDTDAPNQPAIQDQTYILNIKTRKFHLPTCSSVQSMAENNKQTYTGTRDELLEQGYDACGICKP